MKQIVMISGAIVIGYVVIKLFFLFISLAFTVISYLAMAFVAFIAYMILKAKFGK